MSFKITEDPQLIAQCATAPLGQNRTSRYKPLVMLCEDKSTVLKGPYSLPTAVDKLKHMQFRAKLFELWGDKVAPPLRFVRTAEDHPEVYIVMRHIAAGDAAKEWSSTEGPILGLDEKRQVVTKESQGIQEFSEYTKGSTVADDVVLAALLHYVHRFVCDPIVGDAALRNVLVVNVDGNPTAIGIDFEDNRTGDSEKRREEEAAGLFAMLSGGKRWAKSVTENFERAIRRNFDEFKARIYSICSTWPEVAKLVVDAKLHNDITIGRMQSRHVAILRSLERFADRKRLSPARTTEVSSPRKVTRLAGAGQMSYSFRQAFSANGHPKDELLSALQKYVRRGEFEKALYAAFELDRFNELPAAAPLVTNMINRLRVMLPEEIGIASPKLVCAFNKCYEGYCAARDGGREVERQSRLYEIVRMLCEAPKIRLVSDIKAVFFADGSRALALNDPLLAPLTTPDEAWKTRKNCLDAIRSAVHSGSDYGFAALRKFIELGKLPARVRSPFGKGSSDDPMYAVFDLFNWLTQNCEPQNAIIKVCFDYYRYFKSHRDRIVFVIWPALFMFRKVDVTNSAACPFVDTSYAQQEHVTVALKRLDDKLEFEDYVLDQHTAAGRRAGRGPVHFAEEGAFVENEVAELRNESYRKIYLAYKQVQQNEKPK